MVFCKRFLNFLGKSRGFAFIKFEDEQDADDVVANKTHVIQGRQVIKIFENIHETLTK